VQKGEDDSSLDGVFILEISRKLNLMAKEYILLTFEVRKKKLSLMDS
jgi:hypothetical protein